MNTTSWVNFKNFMLSGKNRHKNFKIYDPFILIFKKAKTY